MAYSIEIRYVSRQFAQQIKHHNPSPYAPPTLSLFPSWELVDDSTILSCPVLSSNFSEKAQEVMKNDGYTLVVSEGNNKDFPSLVRIRVDLSKVKAPEADFRAADISKRQEVWYKKLASLEAEVQKMLNIELRAFTQLEKNKKDSALAKPDSKDASEISSQITSKTNLICDIRICLESLNKAIKREGMNADQEVGLKVLATRLEDGVYSNIGSLIQNVLDVPVEVQKPNPVYIPQKLTPDVPPDPGFGKRFAARKEQALQERMERMKAALAREKDAKSRADRKASLDNSDSDSDDSPTYLPSGRTRHRSHASSQSSRNNDAEDLVSAVGKTYQVASGMIDVVRDFNRGDVSGGITSFFSLF